MADFASRQESFSALHKSYLDTHPEIRSFLSDYMQLLLHRKPDDVYAFTRDYFGAGGASGGGVGRIDS